MRIFKSAVIISCFLSLAAFSTNAYFIDEIKIENNQITTSIWETPTPTPSDEDTIRICHATGQEGNYQSISPDKNGIINGHAGTNHQDGRDIIPPFDYGESIQHFAGQNWDVVGQTIWNNNC